MTAQPRVLVTGASGFVARHTLAPLVARGFDVHGVARGSRPTDQPAGSITWHEADLLDPGSRRDLLDTVAPTHLLHAAWYVEPGRYTGAAANLDWVSASIDLAHRFQSGGGRRLVTVGSCFEYEHGQTSILSEKSPLKPATVYGAAKQSLSIAMDALERATGFSSAWARLFYLYGPHEDRRRLVADIATSLLAGRAVDTSAGLSRRDYMYVGDAGDALAALLDSDVTGPVNVATGEAPPVRDLVNLVATTIGRVELVQFGARPTAPDDPEEIRADVGRLREEVGWSAWTSREIAVARTVDFWRSAMVITP
ncbi:MAG TPA: NAD(P)-dependent oxidoreductase [Polyangia bacterium]|nr:NAD(P)-dependent oxidoreductase [Polyangia bacterium]